MILQLALTLAAAAPAQDIVPRGSVRGTVQSEPSGLPVQMAVVEVETGAGTFRAIADQTGAYVLHRIPAGRSTVRVRHLEHHPMEIQVLVPAHNEVVLDVTLEYRPITLPRVEVAGISGLGDTVAAGRPDVAILDVRAMENAGAPPGVVAPWPGPPEGAGDEEFYVRGSAADLQLVLLDGAPVYAPFHLGGLIDSFDPGVLRSARLYLGGAPARFDGGLSYVMDLSTRAPNAERHAFTGALDMVAARGLLEGPLPHGAAYMVSGRGVHGAALSGMDGTSFPYAYQDGLARLQVPVRERVALSVTGFTNHETMRLDTLPHPHDFARSSNTAGSARLRTWAAGRDMEVTLAYGRYAVSRPVAAERRLFLIDSGVDRLRVGADFTRRVGAVKLRYGAGHDWTSVFYESEEVAAEEACCRSHRSSGGVVGAYVESTWQADPRVILRGGLRTDVFSVTHVVVAPRLSATWLLTERAVLSLAGGRYHQFVRVTGAGLRRYGADGDTVPLPQVPADMRVAGATHLSVGLDQELLDGVRLGVEGYYKRFSGLPTSARGEAYNSGMDLWVRRSTGALTGWFGYSLGWYWSVPDGYDHGYAIAGRQLLSAGANGAVGRFGALGLRLAYGAGLPGGMFAVDALPGSEATLAASAPIFSSRVDLDSEAPLSEFQAGPYLRMDAEFSRSWHPRLAGRATRVTPYLRIVNALDRRDALYYGQGQGGPDGTLPLLPVAGVSWSF